MGNTKFTRPLVAAALPHLLILLTFACSAAPPPESTSPQPVVSASEKAPNGVPRLTHATDYLPAAGLQWLIAFEPAALRSGLQAVTPQLLPMHRIEAFEKSTGVRISELEQVAIAGYAYSTLIVARTGQDFSAAGLRFERRLNVGPTRQQVADRVLVLGLHDRTPLGYTSLDPSTSAWIEGDPMPAKAAILLAGKYLKQSPSALAGEALKLLPRRCHAGDVRVFIPGPIHNPFAQSNSVESTVLGQVLAMSLTASLGGERLKVHSCLVGDWPNSGVESVKRLIEAVSQSRFASLLELEQPERFASYASVNDLVEVELDLNASRALSRFDAILNLRLHALLAPSTAEPATELSAPDTVGSKPPQVTPPVSMP